MAGYFLEIIFPNSHFENGGLYCVEDSLNEALAKSNLGKVTGRRFEEDTCNVDVEVNNLDAALFVIRKVLIEDDVDEGTTIDTCSEEVARSKVSAVRTK